MPFFQMLLLGSRELEVGNKIQFIFNACFYIVLSSSIFKVGLGGSRCTGKQAKKKKVGRKVISTERTHHV